MDVVFFVERRFYKARIEHLTKLAKSKKLFKVTKNIKEATVLVAQESTYNEVIDYLTNILDMPDAANTVAKKKLMDLSWYIECMKQNTLVPKEQKYILTNEVNLNLKMDEETKNAEPPSKRMKTFDKIPSYACQSCTPFNHPNKKLTTALEILEEHAFFRGDQNAESRALAFRRGSSTIKACKFKITTVGQLNDLPNIDSNNSSKPGHCKKVIMEILEEGFSDEVEDVVQSEFYKTMKLFTGIFGVGPQTARKWYNNGLRTIKDVKTKNSSFSRDQAVGIEHYKDLNTPVSLSEARLILKLLEETCTNIREGLTVTLVGGFRRGKLQGHDVDLLISHPIKGQEVGMLPVILEKMKERFLYTDKKSSTSSKTSVMKASSSSTMDQFEKCFSVLKLDKSLVENRVRDELGWKAVRVDLIVVPVDQFPFALLGWTGTKHFEREIRRYARAERGMVLTSHGMYTVEGNESFRASSEEEIFEQLGLDFRPPSERCC